MDSYVISSLTSYVQLPSSVVLLAKVDQAIDSIDRCESTLCSDLMPVILIVSLSLDHTSVVRGALTGLQLVRWRFQDEQTLMATEVIADALKA